MVFDALREGARVWRSAFPFVVSCGLALTFKSRNALIHIHFFIVQDVDRGGEHKQQYYTRGSTVKTLVYLQERGKQEYLCKLQINCRRRLAAANEQGLD